MDAYALFDALTDVQDSFLAETERRLYGKKRRAIGVYLLAAVLIVLLCFTTAMAVDVDFRQRVLSLFKVAETLPQQEVSQSVTLQGGIQADYVFVPAYARTEGGMFIVCTDETERKQGSHYAAYPTGKGQLTEAIRSMIVKCQQAGVDLRCGVEADEMLLRSLAPDAIILATGSTPLILPIPGLSDCGYVTAQDMLDGKAQMGKRVLVVGGGMVGCEAAEYLAERGHQVAVIEMKDVIAADVTPENRRYMFENFEENHVLLRPGAKVTQFYTDGVDYALADGTTGSLRGYDNIVLAMGSRSNTTLKETAEKVAGQVLVIGEAAKAPGNAVLATGDALEAALKI